MAKLDVLNTAGKTVGSIELDDGVFGLEDINEHVLWEVVKWQLAKRRAGTHSTKTRAEVRGSGKKPWKQKGTGNARQGSRKSPVWVGGGQTFGPKPRDYEYSINRKVKKLALRTALSVRTAEKKLIVLDQFAVAGGKTKAVASALATLGLSQPTSKVLIVDSGDNAELARGSRNLPSSKWIAPEGLNVYDILAHDTLIITSASAKAVEEALRAE
jgi:large subunit ribosomal protein L4